MQEEQTRVTRRPPPSRVIVIAAGLALVLVAGAAGLSVAHSGSRQALAGVRDALHVLPVPPAALLAAAAVAIVLLWVRSLCAARSYAAHFQAAVEHSPNGLLIVDAASLKAVAANPALQRSLGYTLAELRRLSLAQLFTGESGDCAQGAEIIERLRNPEQPLPVRVRQRCKNGTLLDVEVTSNRFTLGGRQLLAITAHDVTLRRKFEAQLLEKQQHLDHLAHHDQLTGLPNRLFLAAYMPDAIEEARRSGSLLAVLFLDLDRFKHINDSRGHETGDKLLKTVAQRLRATVRAQDVVVRMGGDEFVVVLKNVAGKEQISDMASRINEALSAPVVVDGWQLVTTVSIGVSIYPRDGTDMGELLRHSDTAMYQAKDRGRNNFQLFSPIMDRKLKERIAIEASLRAALQTRQLDVHYQPIVDILSKRVVAMEALVRWRHPMHGFVSPGRFIAVAEETGLIVPIGEFVMSRVLEDAARWRQAGCVLVPIAINVSAVQLQRCDLAETIVRLTRRYDFEPSLLQLELTESTMFEHRESRSGESSEEAIARLRELGVGLAIDDFGTGYSSLSYLKRWRVDYLKIDRSFVRDLVTDLSDLAIVGAIVAMARHLNIHVVAEGIEGWQQLEKLRDMGCRLAQGYLLARPAPAAGCARFLRGQPLDLTAADTALDATGS